MSTKKAVVSCGWDDVPHLSDQVRAELDATLVSLQPHQREARTRGIPAIGSGAVYPVRIDDLLVTPHPLPDWWPRAYGLDVGWQRTAAIWGALDRETDTITLYQEHYQGQALPIVHAGAIRARGDWIPGVIDPAARGRSQIDGKRLMSQYIDHGLTLHLAVNTVEAGIMRVLEYASQGRLRVFSTLVNFIDEWRLYQRDENGKIKKTKDHLMDSLRYLIQSIHTIAAVNTQRSRSAEPFRGDPVVGF